jgi:ATP-dependent DNA helicase RecG
MAEWTIDRLREHYAEDVDLELKAAQGKDQRGGLPQSLFESYSAMANTQGGYILLGVHESKDGERWTVLGVEQPERLKKELWDLLNNQQKVSRNLLSDADVELLPIDGKVVLSIRVPRAERQQRPVFVGQNPFGGTYRRRFEGDYRVDDETVKRMLAEQAQDERDARILAGFTLRDLDPETLTAYRQHFKSTRPDHPWNSIPDQEFLEMLGAWRRDRSSNEEGLTLAGILMLGRLPAIHDAVPYYVVDYQERPEPKAAPRWVDRITTDGTWSGNLFDFYRRVIRKLTEGLKVPFKLTGDQRTDDTPVHEALREALVNTLIHADYAGRVSVLVVKRPDLFGFRNPGSMRVPPDSAMRGGDSDCRNRRLQKMFQMVGLGEQAGSGLPKIFKSWSEQHWRAPLLSEKFEPEQTLLQLHMVSLLPEAVLLDLDRRFGERMRTLSMVERLALATASIEERVTHQRLSQITTDHPHDLTKTLSRLVQNGFLVSEGVGRGTSYRLPGERVAELELFASRSEPTPTSTTQVGQEPTSGSQQTAPNSQQMAGDSQHLSENSPQIEVGSPAWEKLRSLAEPVHGQRKVARTVVEAAILAVCREQFLTLTEIAGLLGRGTATLQNHYLNKLVREGRLELRFPSHNHPRQAYRTVPIESGTEGSEEE